MINIYTFHLMWFILTQRIPDRKKNRSTNFASVCVTPTFIFPARSAYNEKKRCLMMKTVKRRPDLIQKVLNMKKYIAHEDRPYALLAILLGFLDHFLYQLSGGSAFIALFCPVNESVWEHLKLIFFPLLFVTIAQYFRYRPETVRFFYCRFLAALCAMGATVTLFYTYTGIIGRNFLLIDILTFLFSILFGFYMHAHFYQIRMRKTSQTMTFSLWIAVSAFYFVFTCFPPDIPLFFSIP